MKNKILAATALAASYSAGFYTPKPEHHFAVNPSVIKEYEDDKRARTARIAAFEACTPGSHSKVQSVKKPATK